MCVCVYVCVCMRERVCVRERERVPKSGRVWRKVPEGDAQSVGANMTEAA